MPVVERKIPKGTKCIHFRFKHNQEFGMLNLCCWKDEITNIKDYDKKIIKTKKVFIYIPIFDNFYVKLYTSQNGFTFHQLVDRIVRASLQAGKYDIQTYPEHYFGPATATDFIGEYAITSSLKSSDIQKKGDNIYISFQH